MTSNNHLENDERLGELIREAGETSVEPRAEHVDELRELLLAQATPVTRSRNPRRLAGLMLAATVAAACVVAVLFVNSQPSFVWADVLDAARSKPWIHGTTTMSYEKQTLESEFWVAPQRRVTAFRFANRYQFDDHRNDVSTQFDSDEGVVYRLPVLKSGRSNTLNLFNAGSLERLLLQGDDAEGPFLDEKITASERNEVTEDGKQWIEYRLTLLRKYEPKTTRTMVFRIDAESKLLHTWNVLDAEGRTRTTRFDYPPHGPADIYDLGVPHSAEVVDRIPKGDLARIVDGMKTARRQFDDYDAIVVDTFEGAPIAYGDLMNLNVNRVRRKGNRLRVDHLIPTSPKNAVEPPAANEDMAQWWKKNRDAYWSVPKQICDGRTVSFYRMADNRLPEDGKPNTAVRLQSQRAMNPPSDDSPVEWPQLMPEHHSHPHLWTAVADRQFVVDAEPDDGPPGTIRLIITQKAPNGLRITQKNSGGLPGSELYRYWVDPNVGYAVRRSVSKVFKPRSREVDHVSIVDFDDFTQSPGGLWYPTTARRSTSTSHGSMVTRYYLDFESELPDELFEPLDVPESP